MNRTITNSSTRSAPPLIRPANWRRHLGLYGAGRQEAAATAIRVDAGAAIASPRHQGDPGMQLAAGSGRRPRHLARSDHAPADHREFDPWRFQALEPVRCWQGAEAGRGRYGVL